MEASCPVTEVGRRADAHSLVVTWEPRAGTDVLALRSCPSYESARRGQIQPSGKRPSNNGTSLDRPRGQIDWPHGWRVIGRD
jgi:hypothetical protein